MYKIEISKSISHMMPHAGKIFHLLLNGIPINAAVCQLQSPKKGYTPPDFLNYVLVCRAQTTYSMKTNSITLKAL